jgi:hypothetical protein
MAFTGLDRDSAPIIAEPSNPVVELAVKAEAVLGYSRLRKRFGIDPRSLASALEELGIEPFREEQVNEHKKEKARMAEQEAWADFKERARWEGLPTLPIATRVRATWKVVPLKDYDGDVPEFVLSHALEIKERTPNVEFEVEELRVEKRYDPFLVASCGRERFYIDVWDEQAFEQPLD